MAKPDYESMFKEAFKHLCIVSGSRNSFTAEANSRLFSKEALTASLRSPAVVKMHREAVEFIRRHRQYEQS
jgi:hypothetical protein